MSAMVKADIWVAQTGRSAKRLNAGRSLSREVASEADTRSGDDNGYARLTSLRSHELFSTTINVYR